MGDSNPAAATARIVEQLNAGHVGVMLQEVESADEVRAGLAAMRFAARGGTRPDDGVDLAAAYWKLSEAEYREKADPWPLNPKGELVLWAIVESKRGITNIREIAQVPGLTVIVVGAGTLGGVFSTTGANGQRVRDQAGFDAGVAAILSACKEFKVPCSYPANNPTEIAGLMARGFTAIGDTAVLQQLPGELEDAGSIDQCRAQVEAGLTQCANCEQCAEQRREPPP